LGPKKTIIFEPDYSQTSAIDSAVLEKTAKILTTRARNLGYTNVLFIVTDDSQIISRVPDFIDTKKLVEKISPIGLLEFVDFGDAPVPEGTVISTDLENIYLQKKDGKQWHTIMTNEGIDEASIVKSEAGQYGISFSLTDNGRKIFANHTTTNVGNFLGIVLDKVVMSAPLIQQPITDGQGMISGIFTQESAHDLSVILKTTPLPIPIKLVQNTSSVK
jgi:preprotein translocase subunit SecD